MHTIRAVKEKVASSGRPDPEHHCPNAGAVREVCPANGADRVQGRGRNPRLMAAKSPDSTPCLTNVEAKPAPHGSSGTCGDTTDVTGSFGSRTRALAQRARALPPPGASGLPGPLTAPRALSWRILGDVFLGTPEPSLPKGIASGSKLQHPRRTAILGPLPPAFSQLPAAAE